MDLKRLRPGEIVSGLAAFGLLLALFTNWNFASGDDGAGQSIRAFESGWDSLGPIVLLLILVAVGLAFALVFTTASKRPAAIPIGAAVLTTGAGIVVLLILFVRVLFLDDSQGGAYFGLLLMLAIPVGSWLAMADERTKAPYSAAPDLPARSVPSAEA